MNKNYYINKQFLLRSNLLPFKNLNFTNDKFYFSNDIDKKNFYDGILISSLDFYKTIIDKNLLNEKELITFKKYFLRATARTTPFGTFSGVNVGKISSNETKFTRKNIEKIIKIDTEWMFELIKSIENILLKNELKVRWNNTISIKNLKCINNWVSTFSNNNNIINFEINYTNAVKLVKSLSKEYIRISEIQKKIVLKYPDVDENVIHEFLLDLFKKEYIISDLRLNLISSDLLNDLLEKLISYLQNEEINVIYNKLLDIKNNLVLCSKNLMEIEILINKMNKIIPASKYLHIDSLVNFEDINLNLEIEKDLKCLIEKMNSYAISVHKSQENYVSLFRGKFGSAFIPIEMALDEMSGIDFDKLLLKESKKENKIIEILFKDDFNNNYKEFKIPIEKDCNNKYVLDEFDLSLNILKDEKNGFKYLITPLVGANTPFGIIGRFEYLFNKVNERKNIDGHTYDIVEITYMPQISRIGNVLSCMSTADYTLSYGCNQTYNNINTSDILVGIYNNKFIFLNKKSGNRIFFKTSNVANKNHFPKMLRLIFAIQKLNEINPFLFIQDLHEFANKFNHFPRISIGKVILLKEHWKLSYSDIIQIQDNNFEKKVFKYFEDKKIPFEFWIGHTDKQLLLNIKNKLDLSIFNNIIKKEKNIIITENIFTIDNLLIADKKDQKYTGEFIFNVLNYKNQKNEIIHYRNNDYVRKINNLHNNWIFFEINMYKEMQDDFIINYLNDILDKNNNLYEKFFFIRYKESKDHIRLRFKSNYILKIMNNCIEIFKNLINENIIIDYSIKPYYPEINRYGGENLIDKAENIFFKDSKNCIKALKEIEENTLNISKFDYSLIVVAQIFKNFGITDKEKLEYLDSIITKNSYKNDFKEKRKYYMELVNVEIDDLIEKKIINNEIKEFLDEIDNYGKLIMNKSDNELTNDKFNILGSVVHMYCNRFFGIDRNIEVKILSILRHSIYNLMEYKKHVYKKN